VISNDMCRRFIQGVNVLVIIMCLSVMRITSFQLRCCDTDKLLIVWDCIP